MAEFREIVKKSLKIQYEISPTIANYKKGTFATQSIIGQNASVESKVFEDAINVIRGTIENMDTDIEQKIKNI